MRLHRVVIGMDVSDSATAAAAWTARHFAPDAELLLVHAIVVPDVPRCLRAHPAHRNADPDGPRGCRSTDARARHFARRNVHLAGDPRRLGSVASHVLRHAPCPMLVVKEPDDSVVE